MEANRSKYRLAAASSGRLRSSKAAQYNSRKRQSSFHMALRADADCPARPYRMVRSMSSWKRAKALKARLSFPASRALRTREVSLPMLAICCGKESSAQRPFSREACCIYAVMNLSTMEVGINGQKPSLNICHTFYHVAEGILRQLFEFRYRDCLLKDSHNQVF